MTGVSIWDGELELEKVRARLKRDRERHEAMQAAIKEVHQREATATFTAALIFFVTCGVLWWTGHLSAGSLVLVAFVVLFWRRVVMHFRISRWADRALAKIQADFPKDPS